MKIERRFTKKGANPFDTVEYTLRNSKISNTDGSVVFEMEGAEIPKAWSQVASDIMISKYFRKAGVPQFEENGQPLLDENGQPVTGPETSVKQVIHRLAGCWRLWGEQNGYFDTKEDAQAFYDELVYMLLHQMAAPNSPQWFNTGLNFAYGLTGTAQGHYFVDPETEEVKRGADAYTRPQPHACFIQSVKDDLVGEGGIMDLWTREARLFKYGSGTGTNFSAVRAEGETLSGGGKSSGLMSFLKIGDAAAGAIKSGGTTRRAAKMVCLDLDHPEIEDFIMWKAKEEKKVAALGAAGYSMDFNGDAYATVSGQNSNNSIRVPNKFFDAVEKDMDWNLTWRTDGRVAKKVKAKKLWNMIGEAAWSCADPGLQYDDTINEWHTAPESGRINASNPCSEYMFLDNTACNLASLNLVKFFNYDTRELDVDAFEHAARIWTIVLEISVLMAQYPSEEIARLSYEFRTLGLGYANIGTLLMISGIPYDSKEALAITGAITAIMTGVAYETSAEMAKELGAFKGYEINKSHMLRVIRNHRRVAYNAPKEEYEGLSVFPLGISDEICPSYLLDRARKAWDRALKKGEKHGFRNAQTTLLAPTGTIGLLMDCDTTGVEPDFALVKFKKLAGGGYFKIANQSIAPALKTLGYNDEQIKEIIDYVVGTNKLKNAPHINEEALFELGFTEKDILKIEAMLPGLFELKDAFAPWVLGEELFEQLGISKETYQKPDFRLLEHLGFTKQQIIEASDVVCGRLTTEGAPHLKEEHYPVFDTANKCGKYGTRFIHFDGHLNMMAAAQPFLSGAISKTINMPNEATIEDIHHVYAKGWKDGLKAVALYRDGSKNSQPLNTSSSDKDDSDKEEKAAAASVAAAQPSDKESIVAKGQVPSIRRRLPRQREGFTQEARIAGQKIFVRTGEYPDGSLGEVFIDMHKAGTTMRGMLDAFAVAVSLGLQHGVPLEKYVEAFTFTRFEPAGVVDHPNIKMCTSVVDYIFRMIGMEYLGKTDFVQVPPNPENLRVYETRNKAKTKLSVNELHIEHVQDFRQQVLNEVKKGLDEASSSKTAVLESVKMKATNGAPLCTDCGGMTKRNGSCYVCMDCGSTTGCS